LRICSSRASCDRTGFEGEAIHTKTKVSQQTNVVVRNELSGKRVSTALSSASRICLQGFLQHRRLCRNDCSAFFVDVELGQPHAQVFVDSTIVFVSRNKAAQPSLSVRRLTNKVPPERRKGHALLRTSGTKSTERSDGRGDVWSCLLRASNRRLGKPTRG
jgi:hypothetical protein